ncbi:MAG: DNA ligase [Betaproteobacteria bacterium HGW-Betaproteobacteria-12]|nr:MAG: DNA ligase [Betaproteobacteria bacterium HGW-Betaproteobacteria-12]
MHRLRALLLGLALALTVLPLRAGPPEILLANVYRDGIDVTQYLVSEKLDGVRAIWDGEQLRFRSGNPVNAPRWFVDALPKVVLDGELWLGRGRFERLSGIVRRESPVDEEWRQVRYMIFELPGGEGDFRERAARIERVVAEASVLWLQAVRQEPVVDRPSLQSRLAAVLKAGGEGLMLHRADASYESGRSDTLLKLKPWLDAEAVVVGHLPGKGKYVGQLGALRVRLPDGRQFSLGTGFTDEQRRAPPEIGATVTYRYRELTANGLPRFASFLRRRDE